MKTKPWPYQLEGAQMIHQFGGRALVADEMGLGKTFESLFWCHKVPRRRPIVVVCPASVKWNWEREAMRHFGMPCCVLEGQNPKRHSLAKHTQLIIINYDVLRYWVKYLRKLGIQIIIIDECHKIKNTGSRRYKAVKALCRGVKHVLALSGTPLTNRPVELWPTLNILIPEHFDDFSAFAFRYSNPKYLPWGWSYTGHKNLKELHTILKKTCMIRRLKKDVQQYLPEKQRFVVPVHLPNQKYYDDVSNDFIGWLKREKPKRLRRALRALAVVRVGTLLRLAARLKVKLIYDWIDEYLEQSTGKLIIWTGNTPMIKCLRKRYGALLVHIDGSVHGKRRLETVDHFRTDPDVRLCACNIQAAGTGVDGLQGACETALFVDFPWTPGDLLQAEDRIHRIGQKGTATYYYMVAKGTLEEHVIKVLLEKRSVLQQILDGAAEDDETDLQVFDLIFNSLLNQAA